MADTNPDQDPVPVPNPKKKRPQASLNQAQVQALTKAEQLCAAASKPAYAPALAAREISAGFIQALMTDIGTCRNLSATAMQSTTSKESASASEDNAEKELMIALQEIQAAAKQKYARSNPVMLQDYLVGQRLNQKRSVLEQFSQHIINKLSSDSLPGITAAKINNLNLLRQAYLSSNSTQTGAQAAATSERVARDVMIESITDRRLQIQFAADAEWPYSDDANAGIRREFYLPLSKPFNG